MKKSGPATSYAVLYKFSFESAHQLPNHPTCSVVHGHSYRGKIKVTSSKLNKEGFVIDFSLLKDITSHYDHGPILTKTAEELAEEIGTAVLAQLSRQDNYDGISEVLVTLWETENGRAEWSWHLK
jgi:6-pyruvoyl tetrahydropterin synthase/QueD family protein